MDERTQRLVVIGVIASAILCLGGMVLLAALSKPVEDALKIGAATSLGILGGALGMKGTTTQTGSPVVNNFPGEPPAPPAV